MVSFTQSKLHFETEILTAQSYTDLSRFSDHRQKVLPSVLLKLRKDMGFKQIRFHCHKKKAGTVFHIMTNINQLGEAVVRYFTFASPLTPRPEACGSYSVLPDDNSTLSEDCSNWSGTRAQVDGKWGVQGASDDDFPILEAINRYGEKKKDDHLFYAKPQRRQCDDGDIDESSLSPGDFWSIFVRWDIFSKGERTNIRTSKIKTTLLQFMLEAPWRCTIHCFLFTNCDWMNWGDVLFVSKMKKIGMLLNVVYRQVHKIIQQGSRLHSHSTLLTMVKSI